MLRTLALASLTIAFSAVPMLADDHRDGQFYRDDNAYSRENIQYRQNGQYGNRGYGGNSVFDRVQDFNGGFPGGDGPVDVGHGVLRQVPHAYNLRFDFPILQGQALLPLSEPAVNHFLS